MISLFLNDGGVNATGFLADQAERITVLTTPGFLSRLHYAERDDPDGRFGEMDIRQMTVGVFRNLARWNAAAAAAKSPAKTLAKALAKTLAKAPASDPGEAMSPDHLYLVADETGEGARLAALRADYPHLTFKGLAEHLFPALIARTPRAVFAPVRQDLGVTDITLIFATKRSGSSYLADVVRDCGLGDAREHLRGSVIEALASDYRFNRPLALRNFLNLVALDGRVATKLITHFVADYLKTGARDLSVLAEICEGITPRVITLDRSDKVGQAVSAYLAARRGVWHVQSQADADKLDQSIGQAGQVPYDFHALLVRYAEYRQASAEIDYMRSLFPRALDLDYDRDVDGHDPGALAARLSAALGFAPGPMGGSAANRQKLANADNEVIGARFRADYRALFGVDP